MDEDEQPIDSDLNRIKVTVTESYDSYTNRFPVVRLKRLSKHTIAKHTQNIIPKSTDGSTTTHNHKNDETEVKEKRTIPQHSYTTRARKQCSSDDSKNGTKNEPKLELKRKSDRESAKLTISKKQKVAKGNGLPQTVEITDHANEICEQATNTLTELNENNVVVALDYSLNEVVWGKIRGWPHWPARITSIEGRRFEIQWFNDYRKSKLFRTQLFKFYKNYDEFSKLFEQKVGLETAAKEAVIFLANAAKNE